MHIRSRFPTELALVLISLLGLGRAIAAGCKQGEAGTSIYFGNGVNTTKEDARDIDLLALHYELENYIQGSAGVLVRPECRNYYLSYNQTENLLLDVWESAKQVLGEESQKTFWSFLANTSIAPAWFQNIARDRILAIDYSTYVNDSDLRNFVDAYTHDIMDNKNRVVVVGHSQGNLYANESYDQLANFPTLIKDFGIVAVATPANRVGGAGPYTTLFEDFIWITTGALTYNVLYPGCGLPLTCHSFAESYLIGTQSKTKILQNIVDAIAKGLGTVTLEATLDGTSAAGAVNCTLTGPSGVKNITVVPTTLAGLRIGTYSLSCRGNGPSAGTLIGIYPSSTLELDNVLVLDFTVRYASPPPPLAPTCTLTANPTTITQGQQSTLTWMTTNNPASGVLSPAVSGFMFSTGTVPVMPTGTTTYTLTVTNTGGSNTCQALVTVNPAVIGPLPGPNIGDSVDLPMLVQPGALALISNGSQLLIGDANAKLRIVDIATKQVQDTPFTPIAGFDKIGRIVIEGAGPTALISHANALVRVNYQTGDKTVIASGFTNGPVGIAIEAGGQTALVTDGTGIYRVTLATGAVSSLAATQAGDIAIEPGGATAVFPNGIGPCGFGIGVSRIDLTTGQVSFVANPCSMRGSAIEVAPDGSFALVIAGPGDTGIAKIDLKTGATTQVVSLSEGIGSAAILDLALTGDGSEVISTWSTPQGSSVQRTRLSDNATSLVTYGANLTLFAVESDGKTVVGADATLFSSIYRIDIATGVPTQLSGAGVSPSDFALLPGGQQALTVSSAIFNVPGDLFLADLTTNQVLTVKSQLGAFGVAPESAGLTALATIPNTSATGSLVRVTLATGDVASINPALPSPASLAIESSGQTALIGSLSGITRVDLTTGAASPLTATGARYLAIEPGGTTALLAVEGIGLSRLDLATNTVTDVATGIRSIGRVVVETGGSTALVGTEKGIKRVRIH